jgi:hypothetical protein
MGWERTSQRPSAAAADLGISRQSFEEINPVSRGKAVESGQAGKRWRQTVPADLSLILRRPGPVSEVDPGIWARS